MYDFRYIDCWIVRVVCDTTVTKWAKWSPLHDDEIWGVFQTEQEAKRCVEHHVKWFSANIGSRTMKNYWVSVERRADGSISQASIHTTHVYKGETDYANTRYRYTIEKRIMTYRD